MMNDFYRRGLVVLVLLLGCAVSVFAQPAVFQEEADEAAVEVIRKHGLENSQVMELLGWLTDVYGPRLTGSPMHGDASNWALQTFEAWGLENAHLEAWGPFGRGWTLNAFRLHTRGAIDFPVHAYPKAWSPAVGPATADVVIFDAETDEEFAAFEGTLGGKIVMMEPPRVVEEPFEGYASRRDAENLLGLANWAGNAPRNVQSGPNQQRRRALHQRRVEMLAREKPLAILDRSYKGDYGTIFVSSVSVPAPQGTPWFERPSG